MKLETKEALTQVLHAFEGTVDMLESFAGPPALGTDPVNLQFFEARMALAALRQELGLPVMVSPEDAAIDKALAETSYWPVTDEKLSRAQLRAHIGQLNFSLVALRQKLVNVERRNKKQRAELAALKAPKEKAPCTEGCQHAKDTDMLEHKCANGCQHA